MNPSTITLRAIRGAPCTVLLALLLTDHPLGNRDLCHATGYTDKTVTAAVDALIAAGLAQRHAYRAGVLSTAKVRQLILGQTDPSHTTQTKPETLRLPPSSGSSSTIPAGQNTTTTTTHIKPENLRLPPDCHRTAQILHHIGIPTRHTNSIIRTALDRGQLPEEIAYHALRWLAYTRSEHGTGINNRIWFIVRQLTSNTPSPSWFDHSRQPDADRIDWLRRTWQKRLDALDTDDGDEAPY